MQRIAVSENFFLDEFIDPVTYFTQPDNGRSMIDSRLITLAQLLRNKYGKSIGINNWWKPFLEYLKANPDKTIIDFSNFYIRRGQFQWSGYRSPRCRIGTPASAHKKGKGIDPKGDEKEFLQIIEDNALEFYRAGLRRIEDISITNGWLHMDTEERNGLPNHINVVDRVKVVRRIKVC